MTMFRWLGALALGLMLAVQPLAAQSAKKLSELPTASVPTGSEVFPCVQGSSTKGCSVDQIVARAATLPSRNTCNYGDSRQSGTFTGLNDSIRSSGFWLSFLTDQRFRIAPAYNFGVSGETSAQFLARIGAVIASDCKVVEVSNPTNDRTSGTLTAAQSIANMKSIFQQLQAAGKLVITWAPTPRGSTFVLTTSQLAEEMQYAAWLKGYAQANGILLADATPQLYDITTSGYVPLSGIMIDGLHFSELGGYWQGKASAAQLDARSPKLDGLVHSNADVYDGTNNPRGNLFANGMLTGTGGSTVAGGATLSGSIAASWSAGTTNGTGLTVTFAKVTMPNGEPGQQVAVSGTPTAGNPTIFVRQIPTLSQFAAGDVITTQAKISVASGCTGAIGMGIEQWIADTAGSHASKTGGAQVNVGTLPSTEAFAGTARTQPDTVGASPTNIYSQLEINGQQNVAMSCTFTVSNAEMRKVVANP